MQQTPETSPIPDVPAEFQALLDDYGQSMEVDDPDDPNAIADAESVRLLVGEAEGRPKLFELVLQREQLASKIHHARKMAPDKMLALEQQYHEKLREITDFRHENGLAEL